MKQNHPLRPLFEGWARSRGDFSFAAVVPAVAVVVIVTALSACSDGQLSQSTLQAPCAQTDAACSDDGGVNAPVAAGARLDLILRPSLSGALSVPLTLRPVDPNVLVVEDGMLRAVNPGISAVLLVAEDKTVIDIVHISVQKPERLSLHRSLNNDVVVDERPLPTRVQVFANEEITLRLGVWAGAQQLTGETDDAWTTTNPDFSVINQGFARERRIRAPASGDSDIAVLLPSGLRTQVTLEVVP